MHLKKSMIIAITLCVIGLISWELFWRSKGLTPTIEPDKYLFAVERGKVDKLTSNDIVIVGSSRVLFNIQLDEFENLTGKRPIQLAMAGSSPLPVFHDIVETTEFNGTVIVGVTPGLFFSTTFPKASPISQPLTKIDHYHSQSLSQRLGHRLSMPLQKNLVMMSTYNNVMNDRIDLKTLLQKIEFDNRTGRPPYPPFFEFGEISEDRNVRMLESVSNDTVQANTIKNAWKFVLSADLPPPDKDGTTAFFLRDAEKFKARGGKIIFVRSPSSGMFKGGETQFLPRERFYDSLVNVVNSPGYHYEDYEQLKTIECCPEWSHLSGESADEFTRELVKILLKDQLITIVKN